MKFLIKRNIGFVLISYTFFAFAQPTPNNVKLIFNRDFAIGGGDSNALVLIDKDFVCTISNGGDCSVTVAPGPHTVEVLAIKSVGSLTKEFVFEEDREYLFQIKNKTSMSMSAETAGALFGLLGSLIHYAVTNSSTSNDEPASQESVFVLKEVVDKK